MKRAIDISGTIGLFFFVSLLFISCERKTVSSYPEEPEKHIPEYHLIYGPAGYPTFFVMRYSTRTGDLIDSTPCGDYIYDDFCFTRDGSMAVYVGWPWTDHHKGVVWVEDYPGGNILSVIETNRAGKIYLDEDKSYVMTKSGSGFSIYTFPDLNSVLTDTTHFDEGGFLPEGNRIFYFITGMDSLFVVDFGNLDSVTTVSIPVESQGTPLIPVAAAVDYLNERLILLLTSTDYSTTFFQVLDTRTLSKLQQLGIRRYYHNLTVHPNGNQVYAYAANIYSDSINRIDIYNISSNTLQSFLGPADIVAENTFIPRMVQFTPDGEIMYVLIWTGAHLLKDVTDMGYLTPAPGGASVLGMRLSDESVIHHFTPGFGSARVIRINPIDWATE